MSYTKQNFHSGDILYASQLNSMDNEIKSVSDTIDDLSYITPKMCGAIGDGVADDTEKVSIALNRSNAVIEGGNYYYKITEITMTECSNLVIRNFRFYHGISIKLKHCQNIIFQNCIWDEFQDNGIENKNVHCVILTTMHTGSEEWVETNNWRADEVCKNITFDNCQFLTTHYTESTPSLYESTKPHYNTGMCLRLEGVDGLRVIGCYFTQNRGNACIQQNCKAPLGDFEITDNFFYLNSWAGIEFYRYTGLSNNPTRIIQGNRFIGHGLGYLPLEYLERFDESQRGVGTAVLLGGANSRISNEYAHCAVCNNYFEDNNESSVEGWQWNPVKDNIIIGNGVLQTAESVTEMRQKYKITYPLYIRKNPSQNPIYIGQYTDTAQYPAGECRVIENNTISRMYGTKNPFVLRGYFYEQVIIRNNIMTDAELYTDENAKFAHFLKCSFNNGIVWENNIGMKPYFNECQFNGGTFALDELKDIYNTTITSKSFENRSINDRFQYINSASYNSEYAEIRDNEATSVINGKPCLSFVEHGIVTEVPDPIWDIKDEEDYGENGYVFGGETSQTILDTELSLGATDTSWTIFVDTTTVSDNGATNNNYYINLISFSDSSGNTSLQLGSRYQGQVWTYIACNGTNSKVDGANSEKYLYPGNSARFVLRHIAGGSGIDVFAKRSNQTINDFSTIAKGTFAFTSGTAGTLKFGGKYAGDTQPKAFYDGVISEAQVFNKALTDAEISVLMLGSDITVHAIPTPTYDISNNNNYVENVGLTMDGTFGIDTGIPLLENTNDFSIICTFKFDNITEEERKPNFSFYPVFSAMSAGMPNSVHAGNTDKGIDLGVSLQNGVSLSDTAQGGFVTFRRDWRYVNYITLDSKSYNSYYKKSYTYIIIRKNGVIKVYDDNLVALLELNGDYANSIVNGNLTIGAKMGYDNSYTNFFKGVISVFKVYNSAIELGLLEKLYPSILDNEASDKGGIIYRLFNKANKLKGVRFAVVELNYDLGEFNSAEYTTQYPKAFALKLDKIGEPIIWVPCSSSKRLVLCERCGWDAEYNPYESWNLEIANPGMVPGMDVTINGIRVFLLSAQSDVTDIVDATDFNITWYDDISEIESGSSVSGYIQYVPENASSGLTITATSDDTDIATVAVDGLEITITGVSVGETIINVSIPYGTMYYYIVTVTENAGS